MKKIIAYYLPVLIVLALCSCSNTVTTESVQSEMPAKSNFKVIGYVMGCNIDTATIDFNKLTHINFAFAIPSKNNGELESVENTDKFIGLVKKSHDNGVKVFISIGGWGIGDGGGDDTRFHKLAEDATQRTTFITQSMALVRKYKLDGIDVDWEYPDPDTRSADDYTLLMKQLSDSLHADHKELSAAIVHYGAQGNGIKKEVFDVVDWLNLMAYDDDNGKPIPHSPYSLAEKSINYWVTERGLPTAKAVLGLPFYGKPWNDISDYNKLLAAGADPMADEFDSIYYNGINTIKKKTTLAMEKNLAGVMIWEISADTNDEHSLLKAINDVAHEGDSVALIHK